MSEDPTKLLPNDDLKFIIAQLQLILSRIDSLEQRQIALEQRQATLEEKVDKIDEKVDRRLQETRPIWEAVLARLDRIDARLSELEEEQKELRRGLFHHAREFTRMNDELLERIVRLEGRGAA